MPLPRSVLSAHWPMAPGFHSPLQCLGMARGCPVSTASDAAPCAVRKHPPDGQCFPKGPGAQWRARGSMPTVQGPCPEACHGIRHCTARVLPQPRAGRPRGAGWLSAQVGAIRPGRPRWRSRRCRTLLLPVAMFLPWYRVANADGATLPVGLTAINMIKGGAILMTATAPGRTASDRAPRVSITPADRQWRTMAKTRKFAWPMGTQMMGGSRWARRTAAAACRSARRSARAQRQGRRRRPPER
jgi:hypothetical protein